MTIKEYEIISTALSELKENIIKSFEKQQKDFYILFGKTHERPNN